MSHTGFDETDDLFMTDLSESMATLIPRVFPAKVDISDKQLQLHYAPVSSLGATDIRHFFEVLDTCLGPYYLKRNGPDWHIEKLEEMAEPGLVYVWYEFQEEITCFLSLRMVLEPVGKTLYLYEIHVLPKYQSLRLGSRLLDHFHKYANFLDQSMDKEESVLNRHFSLEATGLTVFSDNERALKWYFKNRYEYAQDSPRDKKLRGGRTRKPSFYLLSRLLDY